MLIKIKKENYEDKEQIRYNLLKILKPSIKEENALLLKKFSMYSHAMIKAV